MVRTRALAVPAILLAGGLLAAGCGSGSASHPGAGSTSSAAGGTAGAAPPSPAGTTAGTPALTPDSASAATGDIPDNQVFLSFRDRAAGYSMKYPEGWARRGAGAKVTFRDKNNLIRVVVSRGGLPSTSAAAAEVGGHGARADTATRVDVGAPAVKVSYTTRSAPNPVTGKRVVLTVDRYYLARGGRRAVIDLGTPQGVDNVDAYRLIIRSFRWT